MEGARPFRTRSPAAVLLVLLGVVPQALGAQTIRGRLLDAVNGRPIDLGILVLLTEDGDTAALTASHADGGFTVTAAEPGGLTSNVSSVGGRTLLGTPTDRVLMRSAFGRGLCAPTLFVDGVRTQYSPGVGETMSMVAPIGWIEAVEIYRGPAEIPPEYGGTYSNGCGVILIWLKR